jgi:hypothetical protein
MLGSDERLKGMTLTHCTLRKGCPWTQRVLLELPQAPLFQSPGHKASRVILTSRNCSRGVEAESGCKGDGGGKEGEQEGMKSIQR